MSRFTTKRGRLELHVSEFECGLLQSLVLQVRELVAPPDLPSDPLAALEAEQEIEMLDRSDPALARLFPDVYSDPATEREYRQFNEAAQRAERATDYDIVLAALAACDGGREPVAIPLEATEAWLRTLNAARLALGARLGIETADDAAALERLPEDHPAAGPAEVYEWLGAVQWALLDHL